ncbi:glycosyltransferase [Rhodobacterales bacterium HKCCSP123]|nr:glycosyltransferase [Rhodobacterales bacterium HKCCSP123]
MLHLTVITVVFNDCEGFQRTAGCLTSQVDQNFSWIVIDGGSIDGTLEEIEKHSARISIWLSEKDDGIYEAMNKAIKLVRGSHVIFLNAGDEFYFNAISEFRKILKVYPENKLITCDWESIREDGSIASMTAEPNMLRERMSICHQATVIPTKILKKLNGFDEKFQYASDFDFFLRCLLSDIPFVRLDKCLVRFYRGGASDRHLVKSRIEVIKSLWQNNSPSKISGTILYSRSILNFLLFR